MITRTKSMEHLWMQNKNAHTQKPTFNTTLPSLSHTNGLKHYHETSINKPRAGDDI